MPIGKTLSNGVARDNVATLLDNELDTTNQKIALLEQHRQQLSAARKALSAPSVSAEGFFGIDEGDSGLDIEPVGAPRRWRKSERARRHTVNDAILQALATGLSSANAISKRIVQVRGFSTDMSVHQALYKLARTPGSPVRREGTKHHYRYYLRKPVAAKPVEAAAPVPPDGGSVLKA